MIPKKTPLIIYPCQKPCISGFHEHAIHKAITGLEEI